MTQQACPTEWTVPVEDDGTYVQWALAFYREKTGDSTLDFADLPTADMHDVLQDALAIKKLLQGLLK